MSKVQSWLVLLFRTLNALLAVFVFGWLNIFFYFNPPISISYPEVSAAILFLGVFYGLLILSTFFTLPPSFFRSMRDWSFHLTSIVMIFLFMLDALFSFVFGENLLLAICVGFILVLGAHLIIFLRGLPSTYESNKFKLGLAAICLFLLVCLTYSYGYLSQIVSCQGNSVTTAGNREVWSRSLARLSCWQSQRL